MSLEKIFVVGEPRFDDANFDLLVQKPGVEGLSYDDLFEKNTPVAHDAKIILCFPYSVWNSVVETSDVLYGSEVFGERIRSMAMMIAEQMDSIFPHARYVNPPMSILLERDKRIVKEYLRGEGINVPDDLPRELPVILEEVESGGTVYIKVRYGSLGKGITYLSQKGWMTNFLCEGDVIQNHVDDHAWNMIDITGNQKLVQRILEEDVVVEKAVKNPLINGMKFDYRGMFFFGSADSQLSYGRVTEGSAITNLSQGAKRVLSDELENMFEGVHLKDALSLVERAASVLGFNYAGGDILFEGNDFKPVFLEINSFPGLSYDSPVAAATDRLVELIRSHGNLLRKNEWVDSYALPDN